LISAGKAENEAMAVAARQLHAPGFSHEALLYAGDDGFLDGTLPFIEEGVRKGEPTLVVVSPEKIDSLRGELGPAADTISFADMATLGVNPARIIPAWRDFVDDRGAWRRPVRGIGEPISAGRDTEALAECQRHESLLNLAFAEAPAFRLLCPYDTDALAGDVIEEALHSHPAVRDAGEQRPSDRYRGLDAIAAPFDRPLPDPPADAVGFSFNADSLLAARRLVAEEGAAAGLSPGQVADLVLAVNEVTTNSVLHGGGAGELRVWTEPSRLVCEISDAGRIDAPLVGRVQPRLGGEAGRGLWIANQVCELVQIRCFADGSVVRLHMGRS
jgi:anti-sigma regulatory factor (Ser/Thr protein kinase)